jgi:hypothetical protein
MNDRLASLAKNTQYFATTVIILATLIAVLMEAVYIFGFRSYLQKKWFNSWLAQRKWRNVEKIKELTESEFSLRNKMKDTKNTEREQYQRELEEIESYLYLRNKISRYMESTLLLTKTKKFRKFNENGVYSLPFQKLCGQISNIIQTELDYPFSEGSLFLYFFAVSAG